MRVACHLFARACIMCRSTRPDERSYQGISKARTSLRNIRSLVVDYGYQKDGRPVHAVELLLGNTAHDETRDATECAVEANVSRRACMRGMSRTLCRGRPCAGFLGEILDSAYEGGPGIQYISSNV